MSLEGAIDFSIEPPLDLTTRDQARRKFYRIIEYFDHISGSTSGSSPQYSRAKLIRLTHDYAISPVSQDNYLRALFRALELPMDCSEDFNDSDLDEGVSDEVFRLCGLFTKQFLSSK